MTSVYTPRQNASANKNLAATSTTYATARTATTATSTPGATSAAIGQGLAGTLYSCGQLFLTVDTSAVPTGATGYLYLNVTTVGITTTPDDLEVRESTGGANNLIAGTSLGSLTLLGSATVPTRLGQFLIPLDFTGVTRAAGTVLVVHSKNQRLGTTPSTSDVGPVFSTISTATASQKPSIDFVGPWRFRSVGTVVESVTASSTLTLTEPTGAASGDLIVAAIALRSTATAAGSIGLPSGWNRVGESYTNNVATSSSSVASGTMAYIIRGSSAPSYDFTTPAGTSVMQGQCIAYDTSDGSIPTVDVTSTPRVTAIATTNVSVTGMTTATDDSLIIVGAGGGRGGNWTVFSAATSPIAPSTTGTAGTTAHPISEWQKRFDNNATASGADVSVCLADVVKVTAGATGNFTALESLSGSHVVMSVTFKMVPGGAISPGVTSTALAITAGTVSVTAISGVTVNVTSTGLTASPGTVDAPGGGTVTGLNIHGSGAYTGTENNDPDTGLTLGFVFCAFAPITITGIRFWKVSIDTATSREIAIYNAAGTVIASGTSSGEPTGTAQWITIPLTTPLAMTGNGLTTCYLAAVYYAQQNYPATGGYYDSGYYSPDGKAYALSDTEASGKGFGGNANFNYVVGIAYPNGTFNRGDYWQDIEYSYSTTGGVSANVTGSSVTTTDGTVTVVAKASTIPTGDIVTTTAGTVTVTTAGGVSVNVTSTALAITAGSVTVNAKASTSVAGDIVTTTAGSVTVAAKGSTGVTGDIVTTTAGTVTVTAKQAPSVNVTSTALGITAGTVTVNAKATANASGDIVTTTAGTVTVTAKQAPSVNVTGDVVTASAGTVSVAAGGSISTGVGSPGLTATDGTVTVVAKQFLSTTVAGQALATSAGSVTVNVGMSVSVTGSIATTTAGTVTVTAKQFASTGVTGDVATTSAGTVSVTTVSPVSALVTVTGQSVTASAGSVSVTGKANVTVTGSVATTSAGSVNALMITNAPVTGQAISTSAGTVTVFGKANVTLLGEQLTISDGAVAAAFGVTVPVTGRTANTSVGSVVVAGDANVEVTDLQIKVRVGVPTFTFDYQLAITGVQATVLVGFAQSPNWGTVPDDKPENWSPLTAGTREEWTPVDHVKNDWTPVPTTTPQDWTEADHPKSDWTRI